MPRGAARLLPCHAGLLLPAHDFYFRYFADVILLTSPLLMFRFSPPLISPLALPLRYATANSLLMLHALFLHAYSAPLLALLPIATPRRIYAAAFASPLPRRAAVSATPDRSILIFTLFFRHDYADAAACRRRVDIHAVAFRMPIFLRRYISPLLPLI